jgi:hypothetical protein
MPASVSLIHEELSTGRRLILLHKKLASQAELSVPVALPATALNFE